MYTSPNISLIYKNKVAKLFSIIVGLKQGNMLSTTLFNLFINALSSALDTTMHNKYPTLNTTDIKSLLFICHNKDYNRILMLQRNNANIGVWSLI